MWSVQMWIVDPRRRIRTNQQHRTPRTLERSKVKEAIHFKLQFNNINRDSGIEIREV